MPATFFFVFQTTKKKKIQRKYTEIIYNYNMVTNLHNPLHIYTATQKKAPTTNRYYTQVHIFKLSTWCVVCSKMNAR